MTWPLRSIFGDLLWGDKLMRFIYVDEAGTSENEPVTVIVLLIVNADEQLMFAEAAIAEALGAVPEQYQDDFVFHATEVWGSEEYRQDWPFPERYALLSNMMSLPRRLKIPIVLSTHRRSVPRIKQFSDDMGLSLAQSQHLQAFMYGVAHTDRYIGSTQDSAKLDPLFGRCPGNAKASQTCTDGSKKMPTANLSVIPTEKEREQGYITQRGELRVTRTRNSVHFVGKGDDPLLQLADACAF